MSLERWKAEAGFRAAVAMWLIGVVGALLAHFTGWVGVAGMFFGGLIVVINRWFLKRSA